MDRRLFLRSTTLGGIAMTGIDRLPQPPDTARPFDSLRIGLCADLHQDLIFDAPRRLEAFIMDMQQKRPDFIIQMGDFCCPRDRNRPLMEIWNRFSGPRYHVIGNHDPENEFTREQVVDYWQAKGKYYSFDIKGFHCVVLDGNDHNPEHKPAWKYERFIGREQLQWLEADLDKTSLPVIVFCHQGLDNDMGGIENGTRVRLVLERANQKSRFSKVQVVFSGHHHQDYYNVFNGIHYMQINSMSYHWQGNKYAESPFDEAQNRQYPLLKYMAHYKDPLWAMVDITPDGRLHLQGRRSSFVGRSPQDLGMPEFEFGYPVVPYISDKQVRLQLKKA
jgi:predicted phosphodiesterase